MYERTIGWRTNTRTGRRTARWLSMRTSGRMNRRPRALRVKLPCDFAGDRTCERVNDRTEETGARLGDRSGDWAGERPCEMVGERAGEFACDLAGELEGGAPGPWGKPSPTSRSSEGYDRTEGERLKIGRNTQLKYLTLTKRKREIRDSWALTQE